MTRKCGTGCRQRSDRCCVLKRTIADSPEHLTLIATMNFAVDYLSERAVCLGRFRPVVAACGALGPASYCQRPRNRRAPMPHTLLRRRWCASLQIQIPSKKRQGVLSGGSVFSPCAYRWLRPWGLGPGADFWAFDSMRPPAQDLMAARDLKLLPMRNLTTHKHP